MNEPSTKPRFTRRAAESAMRHMPEVKEKSATAVASARKALQEVQRDAAAADLDEFHMPRSKMGALLQSEMSRRLAQASAEDAGLGPDFLFSYADPGWISVVAALLEKWLTPDAKFRSHEDVETGFTMPNQASVALFSDWGTGRPAADTVMSQITSRGPDLMVHLGDIYYSGQPEEARERFLEHWPDTGAARFALNANHEMYSGGHGYFETVLPEMENQGSYFSIQNDHWRLIGLDSAYKDKRLHGPQLQWLEKLVEPNDGRRNILMSHHQAFSMFEEVDPDDLYRPVKPLIDRGKIHAWFWGHEHKNVGFLKYKGLVARCLGHGAIPYLPPGSDFNEKTFPDLKVKFVNRRRRPSTLQAVNGFAMLRFNGPDLEVDHIDEDGVTVTESISNILAGISD